MGGVDENFGWDLGMAQAQLDAIALALMPVGVSPTGRPQLPSVELAETAEELIITAFLPGIEPQAVQVCATPKSLIFFGQRQSGHRSTLGYAMGINHFQQTIPLPVKVQDRQMQVAYRQGAVVVTLPKAQPWRQAMWKKMTEVAEAGKPIELVQDITQSLGQWLSRGWQQIRTWLG